MKEDSFKKSFKTSKSAEEVFNLLLDIEQWWSGIYGEEIKGESKKMGDEFTFKAGGGAHYSKQKLIELIPNIKVVWLITDSTLSFLSNTGEWINTKIGFTISTEGNSTVITFTHDGLVPQIECYNACSGGWTRYLEKLEEKLNGGV